MEKVVTSIKGNWTLASVYFEKNNDLYTFLELLQKATLVDTQYYKGKVVGIERYKLNFEATKMQIFSEEEFSEATKPKEEQPELPDEAA